MKRPTRALPYSFTIDEFRRWFLKAAPGDGVIYYLGDLAYDRQWSDNNSSSLSMMASEILAMAQRGEIHLLQKRIKATTPLTRDHFEYRAVRTNPRNMAIMLKVLRRPNSAGEAERNNKVRAGAVLVAKEHECLLIANTN